MDAIATGRDVPERIAGFLAQLNREGESEPTRRPGITPAEFNARRKQLDRDYTRKIRAVDKNNGLGLAKEIGIVRSDGTKYPSVTEAANAQTPPIRKPDNICQAIKRGGHSGRWRFAYAGRVPEDFFNWKRGDLHAVDENKICRTCKAKADPAEKCPGPPPRQSRRCPPTNTDTP